MSDNLVGFVPYEKEKRGRGFKNELTGKSGCYIATNKTNGKQYVGSSANLAGRIYANLNCLKRGKHKNKNLQEAYNESPDFDILVQLTSTVEEARQLEQATVDKLLPTGSLTNTSVTDVTRSALGLIRSDEAKQKTADANRGQKRSEESRLKMREAKLDKPLSKEHKQNLSTARKEYLSTDEGKANHARSREKISQSVIIDGFTYPSMNEAARALGVDISSIVHRCKSDKYPGYSKQT